MTAVTEPSLDGGGGALLGTAPPSPAGPAVDAGPLPLPPAATLPRSVQALRYSIRLVPFLFGVRRQLGETFALRFPRPLRYGDERTNFVTHPDHVRSLFANPALVPSAANESPLRPIVGPDAVLTALGARHLHQRRLLLPSFHGEAVARYTQMIADVAEREINAWPIGRPIAVAASAQAIALDVIMAGVFGIEHRPEPGTPAHGLRREVIRILRLSATAAGQAAELTLIGQQQPIGVVRWLFARLDRHLYAVIAAARRRAEADAHAQRTDVLSLLLAARTEDGQRMGDEELRNELLTLVFAGHETTANSIAWALERLVRTPTAYERLRAELRSEGGDGGRAYLEATIQETMRNRPVIPIVSRRVEVPWQLGEFGVPAGSAVMVPISLLHHREDLYPDPFSFRPERFLGIRPGGYTWVPFGGGTRRCLGATLAMAEQRVVLRAIVKRTDMIAPDPRPERIIQRNVTMIPAKRGRVVVAARRAA
jgi:cytochrome P450